MDQATTPTEPVVVGCILVGAEGMAEMQGEAWFREATEADQLAYLKKWNATPQNLSDAGIDATGRPYWLVAVFDTAPPVVKAKVAKYTRVLILVD